MPLQSIPYMAFQKLARFWHYLQTYLMQNLLQMISIQINILQKYFLIHFPPFL